MTNRTFTSKEVVALTGISPRQLQWWDERKIVVPSREGHRRIYSVDDLAEVAVLCELRQRGFSLQKIRRVIRFLQKELGKRLVGDGDLRLGVSPADRRPAHLPGRFSAGRGRPAEKRAPADVNGVSERHDSAGAGPGRAEGWSAFESDGRGIERARVSPAAGFRKVSRSGKAKFYSSSS